MQRQITNIYFLESTLNLLDEWWDIFEFTEYNLHLYEQSNIKLVHKSIPSEMALRDREYISIYLRADDTKRRYKREEYDILAYFGDLGGLFGIIMIFGQSISVALVTRLFQAAMVESTYRIQGYSVDHNEEY